MPPQLPQTAASTASAASAGTLDAGAPSFIREHRRYDRMLGELERRMLDAAAIPAGGRVLDVGCGAGSTTIAAARRVGPGGLSLGIDLEARSVAFAAARARAQHLTQARFVRADAARHPFEPGRMDAVVSRFGTLHFPEPVAAFAHLRHTLKPGGRLCFLAFAQADDNPWASVPALALGRVLSRRPPLPADGRGPFALADGGALSALLQDAGYDDVRVDPIARPLCFGEDLDDALEFFFESDGRGLTGRLSDAELAVAVDAVATALRGYAGPRGVWMPAKAWLASALAPADARVTTASG